MPESGNLRELQLAFAGHIRDPEQRPLPTDVPDRRMQVYRELFYNNIEGFLGDSLPVLRSITADAQWHALVRDFLVAHRARSPYFLDIPREFLGYIEAQRGEREGDWPFLRELVHYEWVELALSVAEDEPDWDAPGTEAGDDDLIEGLPLLSPLAWPLAYRYPVHRIGPGFLPQGPGERPTYLLVYRDRRDEIGFLELNPVSARLIGLLREHPEWTGRRAAEAIAGELGHPQPETVIRGARELLADWRARDIVLGARRASG